MWTRITEIHMYPSSRANYNHPVHLIGLFFYGFKFYGIFFYALVFYGMSFLCPNSLWKSFLWNVFQCDGSYYGLYAFYGVESYGQTFLTPIFQGLFQIISIFISYNNQKIFWNEIFHWKIVFTLSCHKITPSYIWITVRDS